MENILILIPAAGSSTRMRGRDKLLELVDGEPLLLRQLRMTLASGRPVLVTLSADCAARRVVLATVDDPALSILEVADASEGMAASLRAGAQWALDQKAEGLMIMLADMPEIEASDIQTMIRSFKAGTVLRATDVDGHAGHPIVIPARLLGALVRLEGDRGARDLLRDEAITPLPLPGRRATTDLDTPEAWDAWRKRTGR